MKIEIDQSGKIESTNKSTVIGFSNGKNKTIIIFSKEKQKLQKYFRQIKKPRVFIYAVFATLIIFLLKKERDLGQIIIDVEYPGQEALIKNYLLSFSDKKSLNRRLIIFKTIGKSSRVHEIVNHAYKKKQADEKILAEDVIRFLRKQKSGV